MTSILTILMWGAISSSGVSFSGEFMHLDSNPSLKNVYIILEVIKVGKLISNIVKLVARKLFNKI